jgi:hypothetical protein
MLGFNIDGNLVDIALDSSVPYKYIVLDLANAEHKSEWCVTTTSTQD